MKTETYYPVPPVYSGNWTEEDWAKTARIYSEPRRLRIDGYMWRAVGRNEKGKLLYMKAERLE